MCLRLVAAFCAAQLATAHASLCRAETGLLASAEQDPNGLSLLQHRAALRSGSGRKEVTVHTPGSVQKVSMDGLQQSPCEWCQALCFSVTLHAADDCSIAHACDAQSDSDLCRSNCVKEVDTQTGPCVAECSCSKDELEKQNAERAAQGLREASSADRRQEEEVADIRAGAVDEPEAQDAEDAEAVERVSPEDLDVASARNLIQGEWESACKSCQRSCLMGSASFAETCLVERSCHALPEKAYGCHLQCEQDAEFQDQSCLAECSCRDPWSIDEEEEKVADAVALEDDDADTLGLISSRQFVATSKNDISQQWSDTHTARPVTISQIGTRQLSSLDQHQSPCGWCQTVCLTASASAQQQCSLERRCDLQSVVADCDGRCKSEAHVQEGPCLDECPCNKELAHQEQDTVAKAPEELLAQDKTEEAHDVPKVPVDELNLARKAVLNQNAPALAVLSASGSHFGSGRRSSLAQLESDHKESLLQKWPEFRIGRMWDNSQAKSSHVVSLKSEQSDCDWCQAFCLATSAQQRSGHCSSQCQQQAHLQETECLNECSCSKKEIGTQEEQDERRFAKQAERVSVQQEDEVAEIRKGAAVKVTKVEPKASQAKREDAPKAVSTKVERVSPDDLDVARPSSLLQHSTSLVLGQSSMSQRQSPCEWCQTLCLTASASAQQHCSTERKCDLHPTAADCDSQCKSEAQVQEGPCLDECSCSSKELAHQEAEDEERAVQQEETVAEDREEEVAEIRAGVEADRAEVRESEEEEQEASDAEAEEEAEAVKRKRKRERREDNVETVSPDELDIASGL